MSLAELELKPLERQSDARGWLIEVLRGDRTYLNPRGQIYVTTANPGYCKGNHYHKRKTEWFLVIKGQGELIVADIATQATQKIEVDAGTPLLVKVPPLIAHTWVNTGEEPLYILAFIDEAFNPQDSDTYPGNGNGRWDVGGARLAGTGCANS